MFRMTLQSRVCGSQVDDCPLDALWQHLRGKEDGVTKLMDRRDGVIRGAWLPPW